MKNFKIVLNSIALLTLIFMLASCSHSDNSNRGPFNTAFLPYAVTDSGYGCGSFTFDGSGNLLFTVNDIDEIRLMDRNTGAVSTVATGVSGGHTLTGMVYYNSLIYVGDDNGDIFEVDPSTGTSTLVVTITGENVNGLAVAPSSFGAYGGQLIVATDAGSIWAVDQSAASPTPVLIGGLGATSASALVFGSDGTLYVAAYNDGAIVTVTAAGLVTNFATGLSRPDGLAIDDNGGYLYVADSGDNTLKSVTVPGGVVSTIASVDFAGGFWPSPIIFDSTSNIVLFGYGEASLTIDYYSF